MSQTNSIASRLRRKGKVDPATGPNAAWLAISEANRIFGPQGWTRETLEMRNAANRERDGVMTSAYVARIRLTVLAPDGPVVRESHGCGEGRGSTPFEAHDHGIKAAELDATLRALATFGNAFGLNKITASRPKAPKQDKPPSDGKKSGPVTSSNTPESALDTSPDNSATQAPKGLKELAPETVSKKEAGAASALMIPKLSRQRSPAHLAHVRQEPCLICGRSPVDAHHLRFVQPRAMTKKVSDEFTVPLCRRHHDLLHRDPDELGWWASFGIDPLIVAKELWDDSQAPKATTLEDRKTS